MVSLTARTSFVCIMKGGIQSVFSEFKMYYEKGNSKSTSVHSAKDRVLSFSSINLILCLIFEVFLGTSEKTYRNFLTKPTTVFFDCRLTYYQSNVTYTFLSLYVPNSNSDSLSMLGVCTFNKTLSLAATFKSFSFLLLTLFLDTIVFKHISIRNFFLISIQSFIIGILHLYSYFIRLFSFSRGWFLFHSQPVVFILKNTKNLIVG